MKWFKHFSDAAHDEFCRQLIRKYGFAGYGRWWGLVELVAGQMSATSPGKCSYEQDFRDWAKFLRLKNATALDFLGFICEKTSATMEWVKGSEEGVRLSSGYRQVIVTLSQRDENILKIRLPKILELMDSRNPNRQPKGTIDIEIEKDKENTKRKISEQPKKTKPKSPKTALKDNADIMAIYETTDGVPDGWSEWARKKGVQVDVREIFEAFCENHLKRESQWVNWYATWQTWIRQAKEMNAHYFTKKASFDVRIERIYDHFADQGLFGVDPHFVAIDYRRAVSQARAIDPNHKPPTLEALKEKYARA